MSVFFFFILLSLSSSHSYTPIQSSIIHILRERTRVCLVFSILYNNNNNIRTLRMYVIFT